MMFVVLVIVLFVLGYYYFYKKDEKFWKHVMAIPGPKGYPLIGTEYKWVDNREVFYRDAKYSEEYYPIYKRYNCILVGIVLLDPDDIQLLLNNSRQIQKSIFYNHLRGWLGNGLLTSSGKFWHKRRKIITPAFHFTILQEYVDIFNKETDYLVKQLKSGSSHPYVDITKYVTELALNSIGETSFGKNFRDDPKADEYKLAVHGYGELFIYKLVRPWLHFDFVCNIFSIGKKQRKMIKVLHDFSNNVVKERHEISNDNGQVGYTDKKKMALLDLLLKTKNNGADIDDIGIREEVDTFILAGHDTTAMSICHTLMLLANEQEIQEELYQEILNVIGDNSEPTFSDLGELKFMERCIKESLRLYPSVPQISRLIQEDIITKTGYLIPKGCNVGVRIYDLHRNPEFYENPEKFDPDRFLPENIAKRHPYAYLPFSAGNRNCIGLKFAMLEIKSCLCGVLSNFKLEPVTTPRDLVHKADIVLRPDCEIRIKFVPRK